MKTLILIALLLLPQQELEYKRGRPTTKGIDKYVELNEYQFVTDYQNHIGDTLVFEPFISTDDLSDYYNYSDGDMGYFERPDNIIISNEPRYIDYELRLLSQYRKNQYLEATQFVRAVVMHELTHCYFYQVMMQAQYDKNLAYEFRQGLRIIPVDHYGTQFLEEGVCEYVVEQMQEMITNPDKMVLIKNDLNSSNRITHRILYSYSREFVTPVIEELGLKAAIYMMVSNTPPSDEEILNPKLYYDRLKWN